MIDPLRALLVVVIVVFSVLAAIGFIVAIAQLRVLWMQWRWSRVRGERRADRDRRRVW